MCLVLRSNGRSWLRYSSKNRPAIDGSTSAVGSDEQDCEQRLSAMQATGVADQNARIILIATGVPRTGDAKWLAVALMGSRSLGREGLAQII
jgi:hypothetical protein